MGAHQLFHHLPQKRPTVPQHSRLRNRQPFAFSGRFHRLSRFSVSRNRVLSHQTLFLRAMLDRHGTPPAQMS